MNILIADGHAIAHAGLRAEIGICYTDAQIHAASDLDSVLAALRENFIDLMVADSTVGGWNLALIARTCNAQAIPLLLYTAADYTPRLHAAARQLGVQGYLTKGASLSRLRRALRGLRYAPQYPDTTPLFDGEEARRVGTLSLAELGVVRGVVDGLTFGEIALQRDRSTHTIQSQMKSIRRKLGVSSAKDAAAMVIRVQGGI